MKRFIVLFMAALMVVAFAAPAMSAGLLNTNHMAVRVGAYDMDPNVGGKVTYVKLTGQANPAEKIDIFFSYMVAENDAADMTSIEVGANMAIEAKTPFKLYAGVVLAYVDAGPPGGPTEDSIEHILQVGLEKDLSPELAINAKAMFDSRYFDDTDLVAEGELIYAFAPNVSGLLGLGFNLSEADSYLQAGLAVEF